jgi:hypothetical protein
VDDAPMEMSMTAVSFHTEFMIGSHGHRYVIRRRGWVIADTGWHTTFPAAAAAYAREFLLVAATGIARYADAT